MYWTKLATRKKVPNTKNNPTINSNSGIIATFSAGPCTKVMAPKKPMIKTEVALVGPKVMNREPPNTAPRIAATAEPKIPYWMGKPAMAA